MNHWKRLTLLTFALPMLSMAGHAAELQAGTLNTVLAQPSATGTIAGTTFAFNYPLNGIPEYFSGPWANGTYWGPDTNITFTPDNSDPDNPGFTLTGNFHSYAGQYNDVTLGFFIVTAPAGKQIDSVSIDIANPGPIGTPDYQNNVSLGSCYAFQSQPSTSCSHAPANSAYFNIDLRFWNYSSPGTIGYDSATFHFHESSISAVPEPATAGLLGAGALVLIGAARRKNASRKG